MKMENQAKTRRQLQSQQHTVITFDKGLLATIQDSIHTCCLFRKLTSVLPLCVGSQAAGSRTEQVWKRNVLKTCRAVQVNHAIWQCRVITTCCFFLWILICFVLFQGFRHSMKVRFCCVNTCGPRKYWIQICWKTKAGWHFHNEWNPIRSYKIHELYIFAYIYHIFKEKHVGQYAKVPWIL